MSEDRSESGVDQEGSTARTEARASEPVRGTMDKRIEEIRARLKGTTAGPWYVWDGVEYMGGGRDLCIGAGPTWLANMDHRCCERRPEHMEAYGHGSQECAAEPDAAICSVDSEITIEQEANANFIARAREDIPFLLSIIEDLQDELELDQWRDSRRIYGDDLAGPEPKPRMKAEAK